jgi:hypothetical protein
MCSDLRIPKTYRAQELNASRSLSRNPTATCGEKSHNSGETMAEQIVTAYQPESRKQSFQREINPAANDVNLVIPSKSAVNGQSQALHSRIVALPIETG